jgi:type II secretory pathway component PulC
LFGHLVVGAVQRALGRGAVVADDVVDERIAEDVELLQAIEQPSDMVVGVLHEPRIDLHLAAQDGLKHGDLIITVKEI